jgi:hypothetical protein
MIPNAHRVPPAVSAKVGSWCEMGAMRVVGSLHEVGSPDEVGTRRIVDAVHEAGPWREVDGTDPVNAMHSPARIVGDPVNAMHSARNVGRHIGHPSGTAVDHHRLLFLLIVGRGGIAVGHRRVAVAVGIAAGERRSADKAEGGTGCYGSTPVIPAMDEAVSTPSTVSAEMGDAVSAPAAAKAATVATPATAEAASVSAPTAPLRLGRHCGEEHGGSCASGQHADDLVTHMILPRLLGPGRKAGLQGSTATGSVCSGPDRPKWTHVGALQPQPGADRPRVVGRGFRKALGVPSKAAPGLGGCHERLRPRRPPPFEDASGVAPVATAARVSVALVAMSAVAATMSPVAWIAPAATPVPTAMASLTGFTRPTLSIRRFLCEPLRFDALFAGLCLREALALFEAAFVEREAVFAPVLPRPLPPLCALDAVVFLGVFLRDDAALFFEALLFDAPLFFAVVRPRALAPPRDLEAAFFGVLAIRKLRLRSVSLGRTLKGDQMPGSS